MCSRTFGLLISYANRKKTFPWLHEYGPLEEAARSRCFVSLAEDATERFPGETPLGFARSYRDSWYGAFRLDHLGACKACEHTMTSDPVKVTRFLHRSYDNIVALGKDDQTVSDRRAQVASAITQSSLAPHGMCQHSSTELVNVISTAPENGIPLSITGDGPSNDNQNRRTGKPLERELDLETKLRLELTSMLEGIVAAPCRADIERLAVEAKVTWDTLLRGIRTEQDILTSEPRPHYRFHECGVLVMIALGSSPKNLFRTEDAEHAAYLSDAGVETGQ
ncbi:hypothetical protein TREMEDRAFT_61103 [Tremella mesenterica DSM 1558]|uniref:uncharacterized protein n=1 Tax=Tremella mesenterica (strain ATCC 24925 / CBS 8224 / DSM 1558 / NBRC 9311 / NRRL Y-6157 / RJB 2259-6 / UBC 559-6) TaxID=578456 RepID=UPI0003F4A225|nr:uncharacterized protein TREMEDRAFT_61103 [Tremella mesenterica DSM 1558]EIW70599.1 hypothetical protein TREMEDRAFT_61103 [Tremella mesenterica DSM 1558]